MFYILSNHLKFCHTTWDTVQKVINHFPTTSQPLTNHFHYHCIMGFHFYFKLVCASYHKLTSITNAQNNLMSGINTVQKRIHMDPSIVRFIGVEIHYINYKLEIFVMRYMINHQIAENNDKDKFWRNCTASLILSRSAKDLLWNMLQYDPVKRC